MLEKISNYFRPDLNILLCGLDASGKTSYKQAITKDSTNFD